MSEPDHHVSEPSSRSEIPYDSSARLHYILENLCLFLEAVHEHDPLPPLCALTADLLGTRDVEIAIPSGVGLAHNNDLGLLSQTIAIKGLPIGRLIVRRTVPFSTEERALAFVIAQLVGVVVEQSSLEGQIRQYHQQVQASVDTLEQLLYLKRQIVSGHLNPQEVSMRLTTHVQNMVGGERASLLIVSDTDDPQLFLSDGTVASPTRAREVRDHGLAGLVLRERRALIIDETDTDQRWVSMSLETYEAASRCAMAVPLIWGDAILGVLTVTTTRSHLFGTLHLSLLELIGHNVALALRNAALHTRTKRLSTQLATFTTMLESMRLSSELVDTPMASDPHTISDHLQTLDTMMDQLQHTRQELLDLQRFIAPNT